MASLVVLTGCANDFTESDSSLATPSKVSFRAVEPGATRTTFDDQTMTVSWAQGDQVSLWAEKEGEIALSEVTFDATEVDASGACFEAFLTQMERGEYTYYSVYPTPSSVSEMTATYTVPADQKGTYDCATDILVAEPATALALTQKGANLNLAYRHALHALKIEVPGGIDNYGNSIERVIVDFPKDVAGEITIDIKGENESVVSGANSITIDCAEEMLASCSAWAFIAPVDCTDEIFTISIVAGNNVTTFEIDGRNFRAGYISRVIVGMPEVLILEEARTLIDNNASGEITDPAKANLAVRLGGCNLSDVIAGGVEYTTNGETISVESNIVEGSQNFELGATSLASGVYSMRGWVMLPDSTVIYSEVAENVRVVGNFDVHMGDINSAYTVYLNSGAASANSLNGSAIYAGTSSFDMDAAFVSEVQECGISVDGTNYAGTLSGTNFDVAEVGGLSWSNHTVEAYVIVGGVKFTSNSTSVDVTGIPYSTSMASLPSGWSGGNIVYKGYSGSAGDTESCVRLDRQEKAEGNNTDTGWLVSPKFYLPGDVSASAVFNMYHYRADTSSKDGYMYVIPSSGERITDKTNGKSVKSSNVFYGQASFSDYAWDVNLTPTHNCFSVTSSFTGSETFSLWFVSEPYADYLTIKTASVLYR